MLSALGEIWRGGSLSREGGTKKEFVGLSVVMGAKGREQLVGRRQLQDSGEFCLVTDMTWLLLVQRTLLLNLSLGGGGMFHMKRISVVRFRDPWCRL